MSLPLEKSPSEGKIFINVRCGLESGLVPLKEFIETASPAFELTSASSIYQIEVVGSDWRSKGDERQELSVGLLGKTELSPQELLGLLKEIEVRSLQDAARKKITAYLLAYGSKVAMSKALNLPYSEWHTDPTLLLPSTEIEPGFLHPVLHKSLDEIAEEFAEERWGKFYAQGKSLLGHLSAINKNESTDREI